MRWCMCRYFLCSLCLTLSGAVIGVRTIVSLSLSLWTGVLFTVWDNLHQFTLIFILRNELIVVRILLEQRVMMLFYICRNIWIFHHLGVSWSLEFNDWVFDVFYFYKYLLPLLRSNLYPWLCHLPLFFYFSWFLLQINYTPLEVASMWVMAPKLILLSIYYDFLKKIR